MNCTVAATKNPVKHFVENIYVLAFFPIDLYTSVRFTSPTGGNQVPRTSKITNPLQLALIAMTPIQRQKIADKMQISIESLRQMGYAYRTAGKLALSPEMAAKVEKHTQIPREKLCPACGKCDLAKKARST